MLPLLQQNLDSLSDACRESMRKAEAARTNRQLCDVILSASGLPYVAGRIASGQLAPEAISKGLAPFCNGQYAPDLGGYTSSMHFCQESVEIETTLAMLYHCRSAVVPENRICELYVIGPCRVTGPGRARVWQYLDGGRPTYYQHGADI